MKIVAVRAVELLTGAYSIIFRADADFEVKSTIARDFFCEKSFDGSNDDGHKNGSESGHDGNDDDHDLLNKQSKNITSFTNKT